LSPAVTAKAAQQFVATLKQLPDSTDSSVADNWSTMGFAAARQEAVDHQRLLLLYLHSPLHRTATTAAMQLLSPEWGAWWTSGASQHVCAVGYSLHTAQGAQLQSSLSVTHLPCLMVLEPTSLLTAGSSSSSNSFHIVFRAQGADQCRAALPHLQSVLTRHEQVVNEFHMRRLQQLQDRELRRQQDEDFQATLAADRQRERQKKEEEEAQLRAEQEAAAALQAARDMIPPEPTGDEKSSTVRFVLSSGTKLNRKFPASSTIANLKAFIRVHCHDNSTEMGTVGLSTNYPRKTFNEESDEKLTLDEAGLVPQAVLMVQDLDA
jgi:FAS-associated factor 2